VNSPELRRLRLRLTLFSGVISLLVLCVVAALAIKEDGDRKHDQQDARVERQAIVSQGYAYGPDKLTIDRSEGGPFEPRPRHPKSPPVVVVDPQGKLLAGTAGAIDQAAGRRAVVHGKTPTTSRLVYTDTVNGKRMRIASAGVLNNNGDNIAAVVALEPLAKADDSIRNFSLAVIGVALAGWLLSVALGWIVAGRAIVPAVSVVRREEAFLADAAHELRTPVAVIRARAEQGLRDAPTDSAEAGALKAIAHASEQASSTIADMLELARLDARRGRITREQIRLDALLEAVVEEFEDDAEQVGVVIHPELDGQPVVEADQRLLSRAIANLVQNALRYGSVGGEVRIRLRTEGEQAVIEVADKGPGVPPAQHAAIFDRFHRASGVAGGSGLGLAIARLVAESHDGSLELAPPVEGETGARFILRLPIYTVPA
jgi:two-component system OmpR family sensor kinase